MMNDSSAIRTEIQTIRHLLSTPTSSSKKQDECSADESQGGVTGSLEHKAVNLYQPAGI